MYMVIYAVCKQWQIVVTADTRSSPLLSTPHRQSLIAAGDGTDADSTEVGTGVVEGEPLAHVGHCRVAPIAAHTVTRSDRGSDRFMHCTFTHTSHNSKSYPHFCSD